MNRKNYIQPTMKQIVLNEKELIADSQNIGYGGDDNGNQGDIPTAEARSFNVWDTEF